MFHYYYEQFRQNRQFKLIVLVFFALTIWWVSIYLRGLTESWENNAFTILYPTLSLLGGVMGWIFSRKWGGFKSTLGKSIGMFSLGLLAQFLGQVLYNFYIYVLGIAEPYPSIGDVSYFASVIFYIFGVYYLAKVSGMKFALQSVRGKILGFGIPVVVLLLSYVMLLNGYDFSEASSVLLFFDFGWPIGQAVFVSIAILTLFISKDILGGMMRKPIIILILALIFQYVADFAFSYQFSVSPDSTYVGDFLDYLYCVAYFLMAISLFSIGNMFYKVQES